MGIVVPVWKRKGVKKDKNTWRGITLPSVGPKLLARVVAKRMAIWAESFLDESQNARKGRSVDDALMVARKMIEEFKKINEGNWLQFSIDLRVTIRTGATHCVSRILGVQMPWAEMNPLVKICPLSQFS